MDSLHPQDRKLFLDKLVTIIEGDPSLDVREAAYRKFDEVTGAHIQVLDIEGLTQWYSSNRDRLMK